MRTKLLLIAILLIAPSLFAQQNLLGDIQAERAKYGSTLSSAEEAKLLNAVAWAHRAEGWGMLSKGSGNSCPIGGTFISCDILVHAPSVTHWDVLQGADPNGAAQPQFNPAGPCVLSASSGCDMAHFLAPMDPGGTQPPPVVPPVGQPPPMIPTATDLSGVYRWFDAESGHLERIYVDLAARDDAQTALLKAIQERLIAHDEEPMWITKMLTNRYVQAGLAVVGGLVMDRFGLK